MHKPGLYMVCGTLLFCACNTGYEEKDGKIYLHTLDESAGNRYTEVVGADPATFEELKSGGNSYMGKDKTHVYHGVTILTKTDPQTFEYIGNWYYKDKNAMYFFGFYNDVNQCQLEGADPATFSQYTKFPWSHDAKNVFWATKALSGIDLKEFKPLNRNWGKAGTQVIYKDSVIVSIDPGSLKILNENYVVDKNNVFYGPEVLQDCDRNRFKPVTEITGHDGTYFYFGAERKGALTASQKKLFRVKE